MDNFEEYEEDAPHDSPKTELATRVVSLQDPQQQLDTLEAAVRVGPRLMQLRRKMMQMFTYPQDWEVFGDGEKAKACLSASAAIRVARNGNFAICFEDGIQSFKESFTDENGSGYRYIYEGYVSLNGMRVYAVGQYSTRDALLGRAGGKFKDVKDIHESYIRQAAHTYFKGNAIKDLLGLKGIPATEFAAIASEMGWDTKKTGQHSYDKGGKGGATAVEEDSTEVKSKLRKIIVDLAKTGEVFVQSDDGKSVYVDFAPVEYEAAEICKASLRELTKFQGKDGEAYCDDLDKLAAKTKWLLTAYGKAKAAIEKRSTNNG